MVHKIPSVAQAKASRTIVGRRQLDQLIQDGYLQLQLHTVRESFERLLDDVESQEFDGEKGDVEDDDDYVDRE